MIMLAQAAVNVHTDTPVGVWVGIVTIVVGAIGFRFDAWLKDKKDREIKDDDNKRQQAYRYDDLQRNTEIRDALRQIEIANTQHHGEILLSLATTTCKADCKNFVQTNKQKEKDKIV
jgi:hypothetical protein